MNESAASRIPWRDVAGVVAALVCAWAAVWVAAGGQFAGLLASVDLGFHEFGHMIFIWAPRNIHVLAGSATQVGVPLGLALYFGLRRESYASALMLAWGATSAANVATYIADAPVQALPLLGDGIHDWWWLLAGRLQLAAPLAAAMRGFGIGLALLGVGIALWPLAAARLDVARAEAHRRRDAVEEAALIARAPRHEPRNAPAPTLPPRGVNDQAPPAAPAARF